MLIRREVLLLYRQKPDEETMSETNGSEEDVDAPETEYDELWKIAPDTFGSQRRYIGHRNVSTDIKEACFMGGHDDLVACGSDDGLVFIYNAETGYPVVSLPPCQPHHHSHTQKQSRIPKSTNCSLYWLEISKALRHAPKRDQGQTLEQQQMRAPKVKL